MRIRPCDVSASDMSSPLAIRNRCVNDSRRAEYMTLAFGLTVEMGGTDYLVALIVV